MGEVVVAVGDFAAIANAGCRVDAEDIAFAAPHVGNEPLAPVAPRQACRAPQLGRIALPARFMPHVNPPVDLAKGLLGANALAERVLAEQDLQTARRHLPLLELALHGCALSADAIPRAAQKT